MHEQAIAFTTPSAAPRWQRWLLFSPLARIVIFAAWFVGLMMLAQFGFHLLGWGKGTPAPQLAIAQFVARALVPLAAYLLLVKGVERRPLAELAPRRLLPQGLSGVLFGLLLFSAVVATLWLLGSYRVTGSNPDAAWVNALLVVGLGAGIGEEIIARGVIFRIVEEGLGSWWALLISALFFGAAHIANPGATLWSSAAIAIEAGLLFGMLYHVTRSLAACMGLHAAWNFAQGTVYGIPVSGSDADGWLISTRSGPDWLSGGAFGAEASVVALVLCSLCTLGLLVVARRRGSIVPPVWRR
ncbi:MULTISPECIES: CPBP family intramembrane glutamic endopeptidase [Rhodanobacter]|uniref:Putative metal-dependent membrane protease n=1 Tax=Rhodanobacter denitrificans TaxID=666685 RepID=M4ND61_9GAMM|nr:MULTISPECIES: type II CAAX endopeptidase family protein [Rhodanobacter]AGG87787.1 putative metal-dependent membrane protease [Rhodanobacter denitrificans]KZC19769.1 abortive infection protein [Rhodanobacter denitrificans]UJJ51694.1 CPBP family intramembrane metalloprotease [Rhodanobacter denitrificans]UJM86952.1 CPBP family intramembrane metalloprotease [Rhodanobacter denitrificans]UJM94438.1 CPBP family intramembrane metalloprotease [Rhodanobacter denitrificans]